MYDLLSPTPPPMPRRLPGFVKHAISKVPEYMRPAAANCIFPPSSAQMHDVTFRYADNVIRELSFMEGCVAASGVGKGYLDAIIESIIIYLRKHDEESARKLEEWARICHSLGQNKTKPDRPLDAATLVPEPDMTNPALILLLKDAQREGNRSIYTCLPEIDLLDQCCGSHKKVTKVIRLDFDCKRYGAQRATADGITGNPFLRWKFNFSCVESKARTFFKDSILDGTLSRVGFSYIQRPTNRHGFPKQGNYDDAYQQELERYLVRLRGATGEIKVPKINRLLDKLQNEIEEIVELSDDGTFQALSNRSLMIAWGKGCILYITEGYRWTKEISDFVEWTLNYDLWSKIAIFAPQLKNCRTKEVVDVRKCGPANMLDMLPLSFTQADLERVRLSQDMSSDCSRQLKNWKDREFVTYDAATNLYTKTEKYLQKHPQQ